MFRILIALAVVAGGALFAACGGDDDDDSAEVTETPTAAAASASPSPNRAATVTATPEATQAAATDLAVTLSEYAVVTDLNSGTPGDYTFAISNEGPEESHVFMIVQTDLAADELPITSTGQFAPNGDAVILANTPGISAGGTDSFEYRLEAGNYAFICNNITPGLTDSEGQGHYSQGMSTGFTVE